jgi:anti-sigma factor RsiW
MPGAKCPSQGDLKAFVLGELPEALGLVVSSHLEDCPACETAVQELDALADAVIAALRAAAPKHSALRKCGV